MRFEVVPEARERWVHHLQTVPWLGEPEVLPEGGRAGEVRIRAVTDGPVPIQALTALASEALHDPEVRFVAAPAAVAWGLTWVVRGAVLVGLVLVGAALRRNPRGLAGVAVAVGLAVWALGPLHPLVALCLPMVVAVGASVRSAGVPVSAALALGLASSVPWMGMGGDLRVVGTLLVLASFVGAALGTGEEPPETPAPTGSWPAWGFVGLVSALLLGTVLAPAAAPLDLLDPVPRTARVELTPEARDAVMAALAERGLGTVEAVGADAVVVPLAAPWVEPFLADTVDAVDAGAVWQSPERAPLSAPWLSVLAVLAVLVAVSGAAERDTPRALGARSLIAVGIAVAAVWGTASAPGTVGAFALAWVPGLVALGLLHPAVGPLAGVLAGAMAPYVLVGLVAPDAWYAPAGADSGMRALALAAAAAVGLGVLASRAGVAVRDGWPGPRASAWVPRLAWGALVLLHLDVLLVLFVSFAPPPPGADPLAGIAMERDGSGVRWGPHRRVRTHGVFVLSTRGGPYETGLAAGVLAQGLRVRLETELFDAFERNVPHAWARYLVTRGAAVLGSGLDDVLLPAHRVELRGDVDAAEERYAFGGPSYTRKVYYHAIHDIGQALVDTPLLGCTGFAVGPDFTPDGHWRVARAFDFDGGVAFDRDKVVRVHQPVDDGIPFMSVAFAGIVGAVSGVNQAGIAVVINASGSDDPPVAGTPMTLIVREILERAHDLDEAEAILRSRSGFVSENVLVVDADRDRAALFEVSPATVVRVDVDGSIAMSNHFRSRHFAGQEANLTRMRELTTVPRLSRAEELVAAGKGSFDQAAAAAVLSDRRGVGGTSLPRGHRHALNADIATHGVVIDATARSIWVSAYPNLSGGWVSVSLDDALRGDLEPVLEQEAEPDAWRAVEIRRARELLRAARRHSGEVSLRLARRANTLWPDHPESQLERGLRELDRGDPEAGRTLLEAARTGPIEYAREERAVDAALGAR
ncbi:MAG: C45 family peptidase [Myxococcota bacterium]